MENPIASSKTTYYTYLSGVIFGGRSVLEPYIPLQYQGYGSHTSLVLRISSVPSGSHWFQVRYLARSRLSR
jgi:hypothetical protein